GEAADLKASLGVEDDRMLLSVGPRLVVVTRGNEGSIWYEPHGTTQVPAVPAAGFVDSTGAGDSFVAGALFGLLRKLNTMRAGRCAATVASFVVETWGCQTNLPGIEDVRTRYRTHFHEELPA
ncbi:MAG: carbohydrate kinase family protein, partial [Candidatus Binataceae bacterium]